MKANLSELRYQATLNFKTYKELANGNQIPVNEKLFDFRFGYCHVSFQQSIQNNTIDSLVNTTTIFARHNDQFINDGKHSVTIGDTTYDIKNIDLDFSINACDVITLKRVGL